MQRYPYDLSHYAAVTGGMGRLQTIQTIPVIANDSIGIDLTGALRLSPLRRFLTMDCKIDMYAFFVPHRHVYGESWTTMMKEGAAGTTSLETLPARGVANTCSYLGLNEALGPVTPLHLNAGYNQIWDNYFRIPNVTKALSDPRVFPTDQDDDKYGRRIARLPHRMTTGIDSSITNEDRQVDLDTGKINLVDLDKASALYEDKVEKDWFQKRYRDVMSKNFGSGTVNTDADQRPTLLMHTEQWMSGYDVDGTTEASLGNYIGKSQTIVKMNMPPKYFKEHGQIWIMASVRYPTISLYEIHPNTTGESTQGYREISGDPQLIAAEPPIARDIKEFVSVQGTRSCGTFPYGQDLREMNNRIHLDYAALQGFPFLHPQKDIGTTLEDLAYDSGVSDMFQTEGGMKHWNMQAKLEVMAKRIVPPATTSVFAGVQ